MFPQCKFTLVKNLFKTRKIHERRGAGNVFLIGEIITIIQHPVDAVIYMGEATDIKVEYNRALQFRGAALP